MFIVLMAARGGDGSPTYVGAASGGDFGVGAWAARHTKVKQASCELGQGWLRAFFESTPMHAIIGCPRT